MDYVTYGEQRNLKNHGNSLGPWFRKRLGHYIQSHAQVEAHARQGITEAAATGNGLVRKYNSVLNETTDK